MRKSNQLLLIQIFILIILLFVSIFYNFYCIQSYQTNAALRDEDRTLSSLTTIYVITPTYGRYVQKAELIRLSNALILAKNIHWILVEDSPQKTPLVTAFLKDIQSYGHLKYTHLTALTPPTYKMKSSDPNWLKPRGVLQRNAGIDWIRDNVDVIDRRGVVYFADDDNTYDMKIFREMRDTKRVSVWPVGLVGGLLVEKPIVTDGRVKGWNTMWKKERPFPIDMSGFAVNIQLLLDKPKAKFSLRVSRGYQESFFIQQLVTDMDELEPKANNCTEILVWHTRTQSPKLTQEHKLKSPSNEAMQL